MTENVIDDATPVIDDAGTRRAQMRDAQARLRLDALLVLIALVVAVVLCVVGWFLARELHSNQKVEDCGVVRPQQLRAERHAELVE